MKNALTNLVLFFSSILVTMLLIEGILRISGYEPQREYVSKLGREKVKNVFPGVRYLYPAFASFTQFWPSNPRGYFDSSNGIHYQINNYGFRDDDFTLARNENIRIAFLGDSFCWGNGVEKVDMLASLMERWLNERAVAGQKYEVYNFCLGGYNSAGQAALYDHVVRHFQPDALVIWYVLNDVNIPQNRFFNWKLTDGWNWLKPWRERLRVVDFAVAPVDRIVNHRRLLKNADAAYENGHPGYESVARAFERIHGLNADYGVDSILAIFPWLVRLDMESYPFLKAHRVVETLAEEEGLEVLDLLPAFLGKNAEDLWVHPVDQHPNDIAHEIAARAAFELLASRLESGNDVLARAAEVRRRTPPPRELEANPGGDWYQPFRELAREAQSK